MAVNAFVEVRAVLYSPLWALGFRSDGDVLGQVGSKIWVRIAGHINSRSSKLSAEALPNPYHKSSSDNEKHYTEKSKRKLWLKKTPVTLHTHLKLLHNTRKRAYVYLYIPQWICVTVDRCLASACNEM